MAGESGYGACRVWSASPCWRMFIVTEADAAAIRAAFDKGGELSAAVELRRLFPGIVGNAQARECARTIAGWKALAVPSRPGRLPRERQ